MSDKLTYGSLFSGIGGFDLGFDRAGMTCAWQVENNEHAAGVLARHWPEVKRYKDVRDVGKHNLRAVDVICGGFPCQDLSVAGKRGGLDGERSGLWYEFARIIRELRPSWVVIENVPGLLSSNSGRDMGAILGTLGEFGYWYAYRVLDAQYFGLAQRRRRVFIVGHLGGPGAEQVLFESESVPGDFAPGREAGPRIANGTLSRALSRVGGGDDPGANKGAALVVARAITSHGQRQDGESETFVAFDGRNLSDTGEITHPLQSKDEGWSLNYTPTVFEPRFTRNGRGAPPDIVPPLKAQSGQSGKGDAAPVVAFSRQDDGRDSVSGITPTMRVGSGLGMTGNLAATTGSGVRRLTPVECERLQGFPDGHTASQSDTQRYRQLGNAVAVPVAEWIGRRLLTIHRRQT